MSQKVRSKSTLVLVENNQIEIDQEQIEANGIKIKKFLGNLVLSNQKKVSELSKEHRVLLVFIKFFGCPL
jgi:hypothetical protein